MCVSTLSQGHICRTPPVKSTSVVITGELTQRDIGALTDLIQTEVEKQLVKLFALHQSSLFHAKDGEDARTILSCI